jgi:hypothetical protein
LADTLTGARFLLGLYLVWLGLRAGSEVLTAATLALGLLIYLTLAAFLSPWLAGAYVLIVTAALYLCWPKSTSILEPAVMEVESLVSGVAESGELAGTAIRSNSRHLCPDNPRTAGASAWIAPI